MTVKELKKVIETLPNDFEVVISADIGGNRPFNFCELEEISLGYLDGAEPREKRIAELEKENAELKAFKQDCIKLTEDNAVMAKQRGEIAAQLAKAKELIEELSSSLSVVGECEEEECELLNRAEQFLIEVEK